MEGGTTAYHKMLAGEPDAGKPHVRFDEGEQWNGHQRHPLFSTLFGKTFVSRNSRHALLPSSGAFDGKLL